MSGRVFNKKTKKEKRKEKILSRTATSNEQRVLPWSFPPLYPRLFDGSTTPLYLIGKMISPHSARTLITNK